MGGWKATLKQIPWGGGSMLFLFFGGDISIIKFLGGNPEKKLHSPW